MEESGLKAAIIGCTGATGKELVRLMLNDSRYEKVVLLARRKLEEWDEMEDFSDLSELEE